MNPLNPQEAARPYFQHNSLSHPKKYTYICGDARWRLIFCAGQYHLYQFRACSRAQLRFEDPEATVAQSPKTEDDPGVKLLDQEKLDSSIALKSDDGSGDEDGATNENTRITEPSRSAGEQQARAR